MSTFTHRIAVVLCPFIIINNEYKAENWLVEYANSLWIGQKKDGLLRWLYLHRTNREYRLDVEVMALKAAIETGYPVSRAADDLCTCFRLGISYEEAYIILLTDR